MQDSAESLSPCVVACLSCKSSGTGNLSFSSYTAQNRKGFQSCVEHIDIAVINTMLVTELSGKMALCPTTLRPLI